MSTLFLASWRRIALGSLLAALVSPCGAQQQMPVRPADTSSPRSTLFEFIDTCNQMHEIILADKFFDRTSHEHRPTARRVIDCLDISNIPEFERMEAAGEMAVCLKEILDRVDLPAESEIPGANELEEKDDPVLRWRIPGTRLTIVRVEEGPQRHEYVFSAGTVDRVREVYQDLKSFPYRESGPKTSPGFHDWYMTAPGHPVMARIVQWLPDWFRERVVGVAIWKWIGMILSGALAITVMVYCYRFYAYYVGLYHQSSVARYCLTILLPVFAMLVPFIYKRFVYDFLTLRGSALYSLSFASNVVALCASMVVVFGLGSRISALILSSPRISSKGLDAQFVVIMSRLLSIVAAVIIFLEGGHYLGIPVTTLLASAGIGGLAVALAAQDTLRNLFGTIMLLMDKPFRVGERIIFGKYDGVVESIGLRSTRLRLLTGHQATVPNDELAGTISKTWAAGHTSGKQPCSNSRHVRRWLKSGEHSKSFAGPSTITKAWSPIFRRECSCEI